jgi:hypothetical protein
MARTKRITAENLDIAIATLRAQLEAAEAAKRQILEAEEAAALIFARGTGDLTEIATAATVQVDEPGRHARHYLPTHKLRARIEELLREKPHTHAELCEELDPDGSQVNRISGALQWVKRHHTVINLGGQQRGVWAIRSRRSRRA